MTETNVLTPTDFPKKCRDKFAAQTTAFDLSNRDRNRYFYVGYNNSGQYFVDMIGIVHIDEHFIEVWYNGESNPIKKIK